MENIKNVLDRFPNSIANHRKLIKNKFEIIDINSLNGVILFGALELGKKIAKILEKEGILVSGFSDNNKKLWGSKVNGITVYPPGEINSHSNSVIITARYVHDIEKQLIGLGVKKIIPHYVLTTLFRKVFPNEVHEGISEAICSKGVKEKIFSAYKLFTDESSKELYLNILNFYLTLDSKYLPVKSEESEYFPNFWKINNKEVYVDVGAYNGDTLKEFLKQTNSKFVEYYALEPDKKNFELLKKAIPIELKNKIKALCVGAGSKEQELGFCNFGRDDSRIGEEGTSKIKIIKIDDIPIKYRFTTIKMDVEGYEPEVLKGARNIIKKDRPKLAVCVYHRPNHLWEIPLFVWKLNNNYKQIGLRHHEFLYGTVLYCS